LDRTFAGDGENKRREETEHTSQNSLPSRTTAKNGQHEKKRSTSAKEVQKVE
jgi:hypothetical protein